MKDGKYEFAEKFRDAKSSGMLDSNMGRVPARRHVERAAAAQHTGRRPAHRPPEAGTAGSRWRSTLRGVAGSPNEMPSSLR